MLRACCAIVLICVLAFVAGCGAFQQGLDEPQARLKKTRAEDLKLRDQLHNYSDHFAATVIGEIDRITNSTNDLEVKAKLIEGKLRVIPAVNSIVAQPNPRVAALDLVTLLHRMNLFYKTPQGRAISAPYSDEIIALIEDLEDDAWAIIDDYLDKQQYEELRARIEEFCLETEREDMVSRERIKDAGDVRNMVRPDMERVKGTGFFGQVESQLTGTVAQIERVNEILERLSQQIEYAYTYARWSAEIFLYDFLASEAGKDLVGDIDTMATSLHSLQGEVGHLRSFVDSDVAPALKEVMELQAELADMVQLMHSLLDETEPLVADVEELATRAEGMIAEGGTLTRDLGETARAWQATADSANKLLGALPTDENGVLDLERVESLLAKANELSAQTQALLEGVRDLSDPEAMDSATAKLEQTADQLIARINGTVHDTIRTAALYGAGLIVLFFVGLFVFRATRPRPA